LKKSRHPFSIKPGFMKILHETPDSPAFTKAGMAFSASLLFIFFACLFLTTTHAVEYPSGTVCKFDYGEGFTWDDCRIVFLPDFTLEYIGKTKSFEFLDLPCRNYVAYNQEDSAKISYCKTGTVSGGKDFNLGEGSFVIDIDVPIACKNSEIIRGTIIWEKSLIPDSYFSRYLKYTDLQKKCADIK
jgi:hypothetical protein